MLVRLDGPGTLVEQVYAGLRAAILDGNVKRVLARCFAVDGSASAAQDERQMWALAESLLPERGIESYSQGMMDLGATVCPRRAPACDACPLEQICIARRDGRQADLPRRQSKRPLPQRLCTLLLLTDGRRVLLERRPPIGIWGGLLSLPEVAGGSTEAFAQRHGCQLLATRELAPITHGFTHFRLTMHVVHCQVEVSGQQANELGGQWLAGESVGKVRAMIGDDGAPAREAGPSIPVEVLGLDVPPQAGDEFYVTSDERQAREIVQLRQTRSREERVARQQAVNLENVFARNKIFGVQHVFDA